LQRNMLLFVGACLQATAGCAAPQCLCREQARSYKKLKFLLLLRRSRRARVSEQISEQDPFWQAGAVRRCAKAHPLGCRFTQLPGRSIPARCRSCGQEPALFDGAPGERREAVESPVGAPAGMPARFSTGQGWPVRKPRPTHANPSRRDARRARTSRPCFGLPFLTPGFLPSAPSGPPSAFAPLLRRSGHAKKGRSGGPKDRPKALALAFRSAPEHKRSNKPQTHDGAPRRTLWTVDSPNSRNARPPRAAALAGRSPRSSTGPLGSGGRRSNRPQGRRQGCRRGFRQARDGLSENPDRLTRTLCAGMRRGRGRGVAFLWPTFLWPSKER
jgi:hypothetical protein